MSHRVIVIDDNELDLFYAQVMLDRGGEGFAVQTFDSARAALQAICSGAVQPELILLDINMPGMDGFEFLRAYHEVCSDGRCESVPVVMLTSSPDAPDRERAFAFSEVRDYLVKPLDADSVTSLQRHLSH